MTFSRQAIALLGVGLLLVAAAGLCAIPFVAVTLAELEPIDAGVRAIAPIAAPPSVRPSLAALVASHHLPRASILPAA